MSFPAFDGDRSHIGDLLNWEIENKIRAYYGANSEVLKEEILAEAIEAIDARIYHHIEKSVSNFVRRSFQKILREPFESRPPECKNPENYPVDLSWAEYDVLCHISKNREWYSEFRSSAEMLNKGIPFKGSPALLTQWLKAVGFSQTKQGFQLWLPKQWLHTQDFKNLPHIEPKPPINFKPMQFV